MKHRALALWLIFLALGLFVASRVQIGADLSAFLPRSPTPAQQLLTEQLRDGMVSRLILVGIEGATPDALAQTSRQLAEQLRSEHDFTLVSNGEQSGLAHDFAYLLDNRYLLSASVTRERFTVDALRGSLEDALQLLGTPAGSMLKRVLPRDPSGELLQLLDEAAARSRPASHDGVWMSHDGSRALLLLQTRAPGFDIDAQQHAVELIRARFAALTATPELSGQRLLLSGPGVFSVESRSNIKDVALYFALITVFLVSLLLLLVYRSWRVLGLALLPVASGALGGVIAVSLGFGVVYGVTLGFGITLIGEAVDYAIFFFTRLAPGQPPGSALDRIWPTLRLGVLTTVCGFSPMFFAGFPGLAQLGLFSVTGIIVAVLVARWVLPALTPAGMAITPPLFSDSLMRLIGHAPRLRPLALLVLLAAMLAILLHRGPLWSTTLSSLSPLPEASLRMDENLRHDLGAPDVRYLVIVSATDRETALKRCETVGAQLDMLKPQHILAGYDTPARYLPSAKTQQARINALPDEATLRANLQQALVGLPFRDDVFEPFLQDVAAMRKRALLTPADLKATSLELQTGSLLLQRADGWDVLLPLRGVTDTAALHQALAPLGDDVVLLDLKQESDALYQGYVREAVMLSLAGAAAIVLLLFASLRQARRVALVLAPLAGALVVTTALVLASCQQLLLFHLVGLLLAAAVGSNYSLFFERASSGDQASEEERRRTMVSLLVANLSTTIGFGMLAFSGVPLLTAIGSTVALGAFFSLLFSAVLMGQKVAG